MRVVRAPDLLGCVVNTGFIHDRAARRNVESAVVPPKALGILPP
jgi:hypothetical protein